MLAPDPGGEGPPVPVFSNFGRTVILTPPTPFAEDTYYTGIVSGARDAMSGELDAEQVIFENPTQFGFTTGSAVPTNSISGKVTIVNEPAFHCLCGTIRHESF